MKKILFLFAFLPALVWGQVQNSRLAQGLIFHAPLSEWATLPGDTIMGGTPTSGKIYTISVAGSGCDFTLSGASSNASGVTFVADGDAPTWGTGSVLRVQEYYSQDYITGKKGTITDCYNVLGRGGEGRRSLVMAGSGSATIADADRYDVGTGDFSISMKIKPANITDDTKYLINKEASGVGYGIYQKTNDLWIRFDTGDGAGGVDVSAVIGTDVLAVNTDLEFSIVFSRAGNASLYTNRNSTPVGTVAISTAVLTLSNAGSIVIGNASAGSAGFSGEISLCRLFNFACTSTQAVNYMKPEYAIEHTHSGATNSATYTSNFSAGIDGFTLNSGTADGNIDYEGVTDCLRFTVNTLNAVHGVNKKGLTEPLYKLVKISYDYYIPTSQSNIDGILLTNSGYTGNPIIISQQSTLGAWTTIVGNYLVPSGFTLRFNATDGGVLPFQDAGGNDVFYLKNVTVTLSGSLLNLNAEGIGFATNIWQDRLNSLSATVSGATVSIPPSSELSAIKCNGSSSVISYSAMNGLTGNISISGWINPLYIGGSGRVFSNGKVMLYTNPSGYLTFSRDGTTLINSGAGSIVINNWYHFVITSTSAGVTNIYINGVLSGTANQAAGTPASATTYYVGRATTAANYFNGAIDDLRIYDRILSQEEITLLYNTR